MDAVPSHAVKEDLLERADAALLYEAAELGDLGRNQQVKINRRASVASVFVSARARAGIHSSLSS